MHDLDRDPSGAAHFTLWHWSGLLAALVLGAVCGSLIFGIR